MQDCSTLCSTPACEVVLDNELWCLHRFLRDIAAGDHVFYKVWGISEKHCFHKGAYQAI